MTNLETIQHLYASFATGDIPAILALFSPDIVWNEAENFPYADRNPYIGGPAIVEGVFARCASEWDKFAATPSSFIDGGDHIVALGHYTGASRATGRPIKAQFAHIYTLAAGKITTMQQYADTLQVFRAVHD